MPRLVLPPPLPREATLPAPARGFRLGLGLALLALQACQAPVRRFEFAETAMGTEFRLVFYASDAERAGAAARAAFARIEALDQALSDYDPESELSRLGRSSDGPGPAPWVELSEDLWRVLRAAAEVSRASDGAFDVTVGRLTQLWRRARRQGERPAPEHLAEARASVGWRALELDPEAPRARLGLRGMRLDLGGIAKGYALDQALASLVAHGCGRALVDGGGDVAVGAPPPGASGWRVAIAGLESADPRADRAGRTLCLAHAALATSGSLERFVELDGERLSHILDPRSGQALRERSLASVLAPDGLRADAWATALSVLGPEEGPRVLARQVELRARLARLGPNGLELFESEGFPGPLSCGRGPAPLVPRAPPLP